MKNYQLITIKQNYKKLKELSGNKGYYLPLVKNIKLIDIELEALELIKEPTKEFNEFLKEKEILLKSFAQKDDNGEPIKTIEERGGVSYYKFAVIEGKQEELETKGNELVAKYQQVLEEMREKENKYIDAMNADCTVNFLTISQDDLPKEMTPELFEVIEDFVK